MSCFNNRWICTLGILVCNSKYMINMYNVIRNVKHLHPLQVRTRGGGGGGGGYMGFKHPLWLGGGGSLARQRGRVMYKLILLPRAR